MTCAMEAHLLRRRIAHSTGIALNLREFADCNRGREWSVLHDRPHPLLHRLPNLIRLRPSRRLPQGDVAWKHSLIAERPSSSAGNACNTLSPRETSLAAPVRCSVRPTP